MRAPILAVLLALLAGLAPAAAATFDLPPGAPLTPAQVTDLVRAELGRHGIGDPAMVELRQPAAALPNRAGAAMRVTLEDLRVDPRTGRFQGRLQAVLPSGETTAVPVLGRVAELVEVPVPARPIARGETIAPADLVTAALAAGALPGDRVRRAEDLVGRQAVRPLAPGRAVRATEVAAPWAVRRGDAASMTFRRAGLEIVAAGEVLENGRAGDTVRVRNSASGEIRDALVLGPRRVEVRGAGS